MNIHGIRLGRQIRCQITIVDTSVTASKLFNASPQRIGYFICGSNNLQTTTALVKCIVDGTFVFWTTITPQAYQFTIDQYGDFVTKSFAVSSPTANAIISVCELFLPESVISDPLSMYSRPY